MKIERRQSQSRSIGKPKVDFSQRLSSRIDWISCGTKKGEKTKEVACNFYRRALWIGRKVGKSKFRKSEKKDLFWFSSPMVLLLPGPAAPTAKNLIRCHNYIQWCSTTWFSHPRLHPSDSSPWISGKFDRFFSKSALKFIPRTFLLDDQRRNHLCKHYRDTRSMANIHKSKALCISRGAISADSHEAYKRANTLSRHVSKVVANRVKQRWNVRIISEATHYCSQFN